MGAQEVLSLSNQAAASGHVNTVSGLALSALY